MALINENKNYIKLNTNGVYVIYKTAEDRDVNKMSHNPLEIFDCYEAKIKEASTKVEQKIKELNIDQSKIDFETAAEQYPEIKQLSDIYLQWINESHLYTYLVYKSKGNETKAKFPLMQCIFTDIENTIPNIIESGILSNFKFINSVDEMYEICKKHKTFGETINR